MFGSKKPEVSTPNKRQQARALLDAKDEAMKALMLSTYSTFTASSMLSNMGISLTKSELTEHIRTKETFYHCLLRLPALKAYTEILYEHCRERQAFVQQKMIHYIYAMESEEGEGKEAGHFHVEMEGIREEIVKLNPEIDARKKALEDIAKAYESQLSGFVHDWKSQTKALTESTCEKLVEQGVNVTDDFKAKLEKKLAGNAVSTELSEEQCKQYNIQGKPTLIQKVVVQLLEEEKHDV